MPTARQRKAATAEARLTAERPSASCRPFCRMSLIPASKARFSGLRRYHPETFFTADTETSKSLLTWRSHARTWLSVAQMAELVDAPASGAGTRKGVEVRVLFWAPFRFDPLP